jgi:hypothetical protein
VKVAAGERRARATGRADAARENPPVNRAKTVIAIAKETVRNPGRGIRKAGRTIRKDGADTQVTREIAIGIPLNRKSNVRMLLRGLESLPTGRSQT